MSVGALDKRIEAHDTILTVDGETATEDNILRLLRGDGKVIYQSWLRAARFRERGRGAWTRASVRPWPSRGSAGSGRPDAVRPRCCAGWEQSGHHGAKVHAESSEWIASFCGRRRSFFALQVPADDRAVYCYCSSIARCPVVPRRGKLGPMLAHSDCPLARARARADRLWRLRCNVISSGG